MRNSKEVSQDMIQLKEEVDGMELFSKLDVLLVLTQLANELTRDVIGGNNER